MYWPSPCAPENVRPWMVAETSIVSPSDESVGSFVLACAYGTALLWRSAFQDR